MADQLVIKINGDVKNYQDALKKASGETENLESQLTSIAKGSAIAFAGLSAAILGTVNEAAKIETMTTQFEVLTGSISEATRLVKDLQDFSAKTPFQLGEIAKAAQQLLGFGFSTSEVKQKLQELGDVAAASGRPISEISLIFGQVSAAGKLTGERLLQFQERAIPIGPALAKTMGVAETSIKKLVSEGKVDFATFEKAFASISQKGGKAFNGMGKLSKTFAGKISTLKDNFSLFSAEIGKEMLPMFKKLADAAIKGLQFLRENPKIAKTAATILLVGAAITGVVATVATGIAVMLKLRAVIIANNIAIKAMTFSVRGLMGATGIGLLVVLVADLALNWSTRFKQMQAIFTVFVKNMTSLGQGLGKFLKGVFTLDLDAIKEGYAQVKDTVLKTFEEISSDPAFSDPEKDPVDKFFPNEEKVKEKSEKSTDAILAAKREQVEAIIEQDEELREMLDELNAEERQKKVDLLTEEIETDKEMRDNAITERFKAKQKSDKKFLEEQKKFGKTFAFLNKFMHSAVFQGAKTGFGELEQLQESHNKKLKSIGKIAALANIVIKTAESAMNIYRGFSAIPIVGVPLAVAGAAAAVAFGAEQFSKVKGAQKGILLQGGVPGVDSIPVLAQRGELISPTQNFEEVIGSVRAKREAENLTGGEGGIGGGVVGIHVTYDSPEASQIITISQVEDSALGISQDSFKEAA